MVKKAKAEKAMAKKVTIKKAKVEQVVIIVEEMAEKAMVKEVKAEKAMAKKVTTEKAKVKQVVMIAEKMAKKAMIEEKMITEKEMGLKSAMGLKNGDESGDAWCAQQHSRTITNSQQQYIAAR